MRLRGSSRRATKSSLPFAAVGIVVLLIIWYIAYVQALPVQAVAVQEAKG